MNLAIDLTKSALSSFDMTVLDVKIIFFLSVLKTMFKILLWIENAITTFGLMLE